ncbi:MAG TPA: CDP-alcohol phosphatidyltransferase family protein [Flavobacteriales bacterium]|nr:CDP-alcohol phosphatidyltransferase family protein [Flavobacteriales bacterium]MBK7288119.1 CDP-alcohol phosphatidyltransferase family protein [Flavobacteriales bacterium]HQY03161.1 CDP-alcohol phosphatidyltransferase family protein [Flavobacteriales bacterium]
MAAILQEYPPAKIIVCMLDASSNRRWPALLPEITQLRPALTRLPRLPDLLTTANLCCGVASILLSSQGQLTIACWLIFLAALFDVFDGLAARALGGGTPLGAQLDSLADMVSFGVAPSFILWTSFITQAFNPDPKFFTGFWMNSQPAWVIGLAAVVLCAASAWRLAKFNVDTRQTHGFLGLATPANGLFWVSSVLVVSGSGLTPLATGHGLKFLFSMTFASDPRIALFIALIMGFLMVSEIPLPSLKFKNKGWKGNEVIFLLIGLGIMLAVLYGILAVPLLLLLYLLSPIWGKLFPKTT